MLKLTDRQRQDLIATIEDQERAAREDNRRRTERFRDYERKWRGLIDQMLTDGDLQHSNFEVPYVAWQLLGKLAREYTAIFGREAEVVAVPTGPSDHRIVAKVSRFMHWRLLEAMRLRHPACEFLLRKILNGRAHAYLGWEIDEYPVLNQETGEAELQVWYEGPCFLPLRPGELTFPAHRWARSVHDFPWVIHRTFLSVEDLMREERQGRMEGITKAKDKLLEQAALGPDETDDEEDLVEEQERAEGVDHKHSDEQPARVLRVWNWYGRMDTGRGFEEDVVVRFLPDLKEIFGVQSLLALYPTKRHRRPFVEAAMVRDGSYWCAGFGEMLAPIQDELTSNYRIFVDGGLRSVDPGGFYRPASGAVSEAVKMEPGVYHPTDDPKSVQPMPSNFNPQFSILNEQILGAMGERLSGQSDFALGRTVDRPNAPRTATGQVAMMQAGDVRGELEMILFSEDMAILCSEVWQLEQDLGNPETFFRVTEEEARGLYETQGGYAQLTPEERGGRYDFSIKFAPSYWEREARKERTLARYQLDLANPLVVNNPRALWKVTAAAHEALGDPNFSDLVPEPPDMGDPKKPREEWVLALQGEDIRVNPMDNDQLHIIEHTRQLDEHMRNAERRDEPAIARMIDHMREHRAQLRQKQMMQALAADLAKSTLGNTLTGRGLDPSILEAVGSQLSLGGLAGGPTEQPGSGGAGRASGAQGVAGSAAPSAMGR
jgi:hypothetical protein